MATNGNNVKRMVAHDGVILKRLLHELELKEKAHKLTDGELATFLIEEVWAHSNLWTWPAVLVDEAITRLKRADTQRRWNERRAARNKPRLVGQHSTNCL